MPQHEIDAQILHEKSARLRELRLAREAAGGGKPAPPASALRRSGGAGKKGGTASGKGAGKSVSLSDWLKTQDREGRRN
ncbi:MAG: hypothetical protein IT537_31135 [Hyphomicrobiales bacterium]|nr:hypothetical protein [Hyphomicrobiales bacterium]